MAYHAEVNGSGEIQRKAVMSTAVAATRAPEIWVPCDQDTPKIAIWSFILLEFYIL